VANSYYFNISSNAGFDRLLRVCLHRTAPLHLIGPAEFADRVEHKLKAYTLNLLDAESVDFVIVAAEFNGAGFGSSL
jgi:ribonuclease Z